MTKCLECKHLDLKSHEGHARAGFGKCKQESLSGVFVSISFGRDCSKFERAPAEIVSKRIAWQLKGSK